ncbi:hypothetical protein IFM89_039243, partial [Coptis chinensis]
TVELLGEVAVLEEEVVRVEEQAVNLECRAVEDIAEERCYEFGEEVYNCVRVLVGKLGSVELKGLTQEQKLAFWRNIYNSCKRRSGCSVIFEEAVEQAVMVHQSVGRNQNPKGFKVKHAFQVSLVLVICIWLLYQIQNSHYKENNFSVPLENKLKNGKVDFGRKVTAGSNVGVEIDFHDGNSIIQHRNVDDGENGDDHLDQNATEKPQEEPLQQEDSDGIISHNEGNEDEEVENQQKGKLGNEEDKSTLPSDGDDAAELDKEGKDYKRVTEENVPELEHEGIDAKDNPIKQHEELQSNEENSSNTIGDGDEVRSSVKDRDTKESAEEKTLSPAEAESNIPADQSETISGINGFHDENGIPPDGLDLENNNVSETSSDDDSATIMKDDSRAGKALKVESANSSQADSKTRQTVEEGFSSENAVKFDKPGINGSAETTEKGNLVLEDSNSVLSKHPIEEN